MTTLSIGIALVALAGFVAVWFRLQTVKKIVDHLEQIHESSERSKAVELKGLSLPPFTFPGEITSKAEAAERLIILGYSTQTIVLDNQSNGGRAARKFVTIAIPEGTTHVVPSLAGFVFVFGKILANQDGAIFDLSVDDHHLGLESINIVVGEVGRTTATLGISMLLRDKNGDDRWSGVLNASILFLGSHP